MPAKNSLFAAGLISMALTATAEAQERNFDLTGFDGIDIATGIKYMVRKKTLPRARRVSNTAIPRLRV